MHLPPVVYSGPSISPDEVRAILPDAVVMPAIKRGDLYRDRMLGFSFFLILDGVFFHELAIPPRELLDVLADGAVLVGATSMGAIRAAECWPAGMLGVGAIYRLFKRGSLRSDDEVAVAFGPVNPHLMSTVPLVNVRYAVSRAMRAGEIGQNLARNIVRSAETTFYPERNWRTILLAAGQPDADGQLKKCLSKYDLKRLDAVRALRYCSSMLAHDPSLVDVPRKTDLPFIPNQFTRERRHDPFGAKGTGTVKSAMWRWMLASGRIRRYAFLAEWYERYLKTGDAPDSVFPDTAWQNLVDLGEIESLGYRYRAISEAVKEAVNRGLSPGPGHHYQAEVEIAIEHGYPAWSVLEKNVQARGSAWNQIVEYRDKLSLAKCLRAMLF